MNRRRVILAAALIGASIGSTIPAVAYWAEFSPVTATVAVAGLRAPGVAVTVTGTTATLAITAPADGPLPTGYTVTYETGPDQQTTEPGQHPTEPGQHPTGPSQHPTGPSQHPTGPSQHTICAGLTTPGTCTDDLGSHAAQRHYTVTAQLGDHWRTSVQRIAYTTPPTPTITLKASSDTGVPHDGDTNDPTPTVVLDAPESAEGYAVELRVDDTVADVVAVPPEGFTARDVDLPPLPDGDHTIKAVAVYHGTTAEKPLPVTVLTGTPTLTAVTLIGGNAKASRLDRVAVDVDRRLDPRSVCASWGATPGTAYSLPNRVTVTLGHEAGSADATLTLAPAPGACGSAGASGGEATNAIHLGTITVDGGYLQAGAPAVVFTGSTLQLSANWQRLTLVLGSPSSERLGMVTAPVRPALTPDAPNLTDYTGNAVPGDTWTSKVPSGF